MLFCKHCTFSCDTSQKLGIHYNRSHGFTLHTCPGCDKDFNSTAALCYHKKHCPKFQQASVSSKTSIREEESSVQNISQSNTSITGESSVLNTSQLSSQAEIGKSSNIVCGLCLGDSCSEVIPSVQDLCDHLSSFHGISADIQNIEFPSTVEFQKWKAEVQNDGNFEFACKKTRPNVNSVVKYYYCHRSGIYVSQSKGLRAPKKIGSVKTGFWCSAFAVVTTYSTDAVSVTYCLDHYGHDDNVARLHLQQDIKSRIAQYVRDKQTIDWIMEKIRSKYLKICIASRFYAVLKKQLLYLGDFNDISAEQLDFHDKIMSRQNCMTRDDVRNVITSLGLASDRRDNNDYISVDLLVKERENNPVSPFFCYQPQTSDDQTFTLGMTHFL